MNLLTRLKRQNFYYYLTHIIIYLLPNLIFQKKRKYWVHYKNKNLKKRLQYYISPSICYEDISKWVFLKNFKRPKKGTMYFFDLVKYTKYFDENKKINFKFGDITENFDEPILVKSRPINHNGNSVLMKLDSLRHYHFLEHDIPFEQKNDYIVWRGGVHSKSRKFLVEKFHNHPLCNIGDVSTDNQLPMGWRKKYLNYKQQLQYKFILSIEGNDVATNLKWILSSSSLCLMPMPRYETWFMEGKLIPNFHFVLLKDDYSDMIDKRNYYLENIVEAKKIIKNANDWVHQFKDSSIEKALSIQVLNRFFLQTNQTK